MKTENHKREYCQHCGVDFTNRPYAEKIHHSNHCDEYNAAVYTRRFKDAKTAKEKLEWLFESIGIDTNIDRTTYKATMEIFDCLVKMFRNGFYDDDTEDDKAFPKIADYMESKRGAVKKEFNSRIQEKINEVRRNCDVEIEGLKIHLVK